MTVTINIPKEFEEHFNNDKFADSFERVRADIQYNLNTSDICLAGNYELELIDMLRKAFEKADKPLVPPLNTLSDFSGYHFVPVEVEMDHVFCPKGET